MGKIFFELLEVLVGVEFCNRVCPVDTGENTFSYLAGTCTESRQDSDGLASAKYGRLWTKD